MENTQAAMYMLTNCLPPSCHDVLIYKLHNKKLFAKQMLKLLVK